jgi:hypothetical protein
MVPSPTPGVRLRVAALVIVTLGVILTSCPAQAQSAPPTSAPPTTSPAAGPATSTPGVPPPPEAAQGRCDGLTFPASAVCKVATTAAPTFNPFDLAIRAMAGVVADMAVFFLNRAGSSITAQTTPDLSLPWFTNSYGSTLTVGLSLIGLFLLLGVMQCLFRGAGAEMARLALLYLPAAVVLMFLAPTFTNLLLALVDAYTAWVTQDAAQNIKAATERVTEVLTNLTTNTPPPYDQMPIGVGMFMAFLIVVGSVVVWLELLLRDAAVYAVSVLVPLGLASMVWPAVRAWCRRIIEVLVAVIVAKLVVVAVVDLAAAGLATTKPADAFATLGACTTLLLLAAFTPIAVLKLVPIAGAEFSAALHLRPGLTQAAATTGALQAVSSVRHAVMSNFRAGAVAAAGRAGAGPAAGSAGGLRGLGFGGGQPPPAPPPAPPRSVPPRRERE